jgi:hypothetical protein
VQANEADTETLPLEESMPAPPLVLQTVLLAMERATTEEEALAALEPFLADATAMFTPGTDPLAAITALFGSECAADVIEAGAAVVVELEAEAAATGGLITEQAARRVTRSIVHRLTARASRARDLASHPRRAPRVRILRAPRARSTHRRAVRLSAVASAGDGPSPEERPRKAIRIVVQVDDVSRWPPWSALVSLDESFTCQGVRS